MTERADGYVQDESSQWVAAAVEASDGERVLDVCAAPGGKATAMAAGGCDGRSPAISVSAASGSVARQRQRASTSTCRWWPPMAPRHRSDRRRSTPCCSTLRAPASVRCAAGPTPAGGSSRTTSPNWRRSRPSCWRRRLRSSRPAVGSCTASARSPPPNRSTTRLPAGFEVDPTPPPVGTWRPFEQGWRVLPHDADTDGMVMIRYRRIIVSDQ